MISISKHGGPFGGGKTLELNVPKKDAVIKAGETIKAGDLVSFINGEASKTTEYDFAISMMGPQGYLLGGITIRYQQPFKIDEQTVLLFYGDVDDLYYGKAVFLTISGTTVTAGTPFVLATERANDLSVFRLTDNKFFINYTSTSGTETSSKALVVELSGTTLTLGTSFLYPESSQSKRLTKISETEVMIAFRDKQYATPLLSVAIFTVSGTTISLGASTIVYNEATDDYFSIGSFAPRKAIIAFTNGAATQSLSSVLTVGSDGSVTAGATNMFNSSRKMTTDGHFTVIGENKVLYVENYNLSVECSVSTISGDVVTTGLGYRDIGHGLSAQTISLRDNEAFIGTRNNSYSDRCDFSRVTVEGTVITYRYTKIINDGTSGAPAMVALADNTLLLTFLVGVNSDAKCLVLKEPGKLAGLALQDGVGGETKKFYDWSGLAK